MTSTPLPNLAGPNRPAPLLSSFGWAWVAICTILFGWMHWEFVYRTYLFSKDPNWSHVLIVPAISIYFIVQHKARLQAAPKRVFWAALPLVFVGLYSYLWWIYPGRNDMFRGYSMIFTVFATVLFLLGPAAMRVLWFPIAYLAFAVKISDAIWSRVAERLQDVASVGATYCLEVVAVFLKFNIETTGNTIVLSFWKDGKWIEEGMNVAEACAGLRMLMAFIALGVALAFLFDRAWWQRLIMISLAVPIAVAVNIGRVTVLGILYTINKDYAQGDFHIFIGMLMLIPAAGMFLLVGWILDKAIVREDKKDNAEAEKTTAAVGGWAAGKIIAKPVSKPADERKPMGGLIAKGLVFGALLSLGTGLTYAMLFNVFSARPLFEAISPSVSMVLLIVAVVFLGIVGVLSFKLSPSRSGAAATMYATALIAGVFAVASTGQHSVIAWQKVVLHKEAVELRHQLVHLPLEKGPYVFLKNDELAPEIIDELGTEEYLSRWYIDTRLKENAPGAMVRLHVTYYTGLVDTVPHVPDRCFVAGGAEHKGLHDMIIALDPSIFTENTEAGGYQAQAVLPPPGGDPFGPGTVVNLPQRNITATRFTYGVGENDDYDAHVAYFFAANGKFLNSPNAVRLQGFDIRDKYSYYAKIEVQILGETDPEMVKQRSTELLNTFMPEIMACMPDWNDVRAGLWPPDAKKDAEP